VKKRRPDPYIRDSLKSQPLFLGLATDEDYPHQGYLDFAAITLDPATGTMELRGVFENPDRQLVPESASATATLGISPFTATALKVEQRALRRMPRNRVG
jgi:hypothetical protein